MAHLIMEVRLRKAPAGGRGNASALLGDAGSGPSALIRSVYQRYNIKKSPPGEGGLGEVEMSVDAISISQAGRLQRTGIYLVRWVAYYVLLVNL